MVSYRFKFPLDCRTGFGRAYARNMAVSYFYSGRYAFICSCLIRHYLFFIFYFFQVKDVMKSYREELWFNTKTRRDYLNITDEVQKAVDKSGIKEGLCLVNAMHISASVYINDDEQGLLNDYDKWLEKLAPHEPISQYQHNDTGEDNADAHLKRQIMGREVVVAVTNGKLDFGPWEQIFYGEFDGRRKKRVLMKIIGE